MEQACCAHKKILGKTTKPDDGGYTKDYWVCGDCGTEMKIEPFVPPTYYLIDKRTALQVGEILNMVIKGVGCSPFIKRIVHDFHSGLHTTDHIPEDFND